jgi:dGTPase
MAVIEYAPFACDPAQSRGRLYPEQESATRTCFQRDRDRIIHSTAFRRLEYKTQVFVNSEGDHYRTRLTHSLEVAQIARTIARALGLNEDLAEALALAHDLGHTPFGHAGEDALAELMAPYGGFDHNAQSLALVTRLELRYPDFEGLNLTWECLEGLVKHNGPLLGLGNTIAIPRQIADYNRLHDLALTSYASAEAQVAAIADDIAYNNHDIDDGLRAGLFSVADLSDVPLVGRVFADVLYEYPALDSARQSAEAVRRLIGEMVGNCLAESRARIGSVPLRCADDVRALERSVIAFSDEMAGHEQSLKAFLFENMYRHERVTRMTEEAGRVVRDLFLVFMDSPQRLPAEWRARAGAPRREPTAWVVADYIAGMTDRFAHEERERLFPVDRQTA